MTNRWRETQLAPGANPDRLLENNEQSRAGWQCPSCGLKREQDFGPDPCLGELPGVRFACCGHGGFGDCPGYIMFNNGKTVRFGSYGRVDGVNCATATVPYEGRFKK